MTVRELIQKLVDFDMDQDVYIRTKKHIHALSTDENVADIDYVSNAYNLDDYDLNDYDVIIDVRDIKL